jgi:hypothetical protein
MGFEYNHSGKKIPEHFILWTKFPLKRRIGKRKRTKAYACRFGLGWLANYIVNNHYMFIMSHQSRHTSSEEEDKF